MKKNLTEKIVKTLVYYQKKLLLKLRLLRFEINQVSLSRPIFVVGCSRAGTTLVYKTLSKSKCLGSLQKETHDFWAALHPPQTRNWDSHEIPEHDADDADRTSVNRFFYSRLGPTRFVDKNNQNGLSIAYLLKLYPDAHFIYIKRAPGDNINSLIHGWGKADEFGTWSDALPTEINIEKSKYKHWCFFLAHGWRDYTEASIEAVCAFQYKAINSAILQAKQKVPMSQWHEIKYEALISAPVDQFNKLFSECDVPFDDVLTRHCQHVLNTPYNAFSEIRIDKWRDGEHQQKIQKVLPQVAEIAEAMGYSV